MGVRLLSSIFGKNPSPSPTSGDSSPPPTAVPTTSPVAKTRLGSSSKEPTDNNDAVFTEEPSNKRSTAAPSKLGIGVGGNVLAEMKARQERRISGIMKQNSADESDISERSEKTETGSSVSKSSSLSPNPLGGIRLRPTPPTPEETEPPPKLPEKTGIRFGARPPLAAPTPSEELANIRLRPRGASEEPEAPTTTSSAVPKQETVNQFRLRSTNEEPPTPEPSETKTNPLSGVRLRSTGINVTDPLKSPVNESSSEPKNNDARNSLSKLKPPPLAPKPRPWSIVGSDKKPGI